jgi:hypothetical protein
MTKSKFAPLFIFLVLLAPGTGFANYASDYDSDYDTYRSDYDAVRGLSCGAQSVGRSQREERLVRLPTLPIRDIANDPIAARYAKEHPVIISLTTIPARIGELHKVIKRLDLRLVSHVVVTIGKAFSRTGEAYVIPPELRQMPKVKILVIDTDLGPITKMLRAVEWAAGNDPDAVVISIDDDIAYPPGLVADMIYFHSRHKNAVFSASVAKRLGAWGIEEGLWPVPGRPVAIPEGWSGISYKAGEIPTELMRQLALLTDHTFLSDDVIIGVALALAGIESRPIETEFYQRSFPVALEQHFTEHALHNGAGSERYTGGDYNRVKYRHALLAIREAINSEGLRRFLVGLGRS